MTHFVCCLASRRGEARCHRRPLQADMASSDGAGALDGAKYADLPGASLRIFEWGGRIVGRVANLPQNTLKIGKTPDFGHFILESGGGSTRPVFKSAGVRTPPPPTLPSATPLRPTPTARWRRLPREGRQLEPEAGHWRGRAAGFRLRGAGWPISPRYCHGPETWRRTRDLASPAGVRQRSRPHLCTVPHVPALAPRQMCRPQGSRHQPPRQGAGNLGLPRLPSDAPCDAPRGPEAADPADPTRTSTDTDTTATAANGEERRDPDGGNGTTGAAAGSTPSRDDRTTAGEKRLTAAQDTAVKLQRPGRPTNRALEAPGGQQAACSPPAGDEAGRPGRRTPIPGVQRGRQTRQPERDQPANDTA